MTDARSERLVVGGVALEAWRLGPGPSGAPTVVMLHDGDGSAGDWGGLAQRLVRATGVGVLLYSRVGAGRSDPAPRGWAPAHLEQEALEVLPAVLTAAGFERGVLLGHGDGAAIATMYLGGVEDHRVRGLVLLAPRFFVEQRALEAHERGRVDTGTPEAVRRWHEAWLHPESRTWDIRERLGYVRVPILLVQGAGDPYATEAQVVAAEEETYCPVDVARIDGAAAAPHLEQPEATLAAVTRYLETLLVTMGEGAPASRVEGR